MSGVINAFRNITSDPLWIIKIAVYSIPLYLYFAYKKAVLSLFIHDYIFYVALSVFYIGISSILMNRNIHNKRPILPFFLDLFEFIVKTIGSVLASLPILMIICYLIYFIDNTLVLRDASVLNIVKISAVVLLFPFVCMPVVIFSANGKLIDVIKSFHVFFDCGSFIENFLLFLIQSIFTMGITVILIYFAIKQYIGLDSVYAYAFYSFSVSLYILMFFSWASDLYGDVIPEITYNRK